MAKYGTREYYLEEATKAKFKEELIRRGGTALLVEQVQSGKVNTNILLLVADQINSAIASYDYAMKALHEYDANHPDEVPKDMQKEKTQKPAPAVVEEDPFAENTTDKKEKKHA